MIVVWSLTSQDCYNWLYPPKIIYSIINFWIFFWFLILCSGRWTHIRLNILHFTNWTIFKIILFICPHHTLLTITLTISFIISFSFILSWILWNLCLTFLGRSITQSRTSITNLRIYISCPITIFFIYWGNLRSFLSQ
jgi:hypothetical protein